MVSTEVGDRSGSPRADSFLHFLAHCDFSDAINMVFFFALSFGLVPMPWSCFFMSLFHLTIPLCTLLLFVLDRKSVVYGKSVRHGVDVGRLLVVQ